MLQMFLQHHKIPYVFYWALSNDLPENDVNGKQRPDLALFKKQIDTNRFFNFEASSHVKDNVQMQIKNRSSADHKVQVSNEDYVQSQFEYVAKNGWTKSENDGHPNQQGHHMWGQLLYEFVNARKLL